MLGDFNDISDPSHKSGGPRRTQGSCRKFAQVLQTFSVKQVQYKGSKYKWHGKRRQHQVKLMLDKAYGNSHWHQMHPNALATNLPWIGSDHRPVLIDTEKNELHTHKRFYFNNAWFKLHRYNSFFATVWNEINTNDAPTTIQDNLQQIQDKITDWKPTIIPNAARWIASLKKNLNRLYAAPTWDEKAIHSTKQALIHFTKLEEEYWRNRSRATWLKQGDKNTKFFQAKMNQRRFTNRILVIKDPTGQHHTEPEDIRTVFANHFKDIFTNQCQPINDPPLDIKQIITEEMNSNLTAPVTTQEVKQAVFQMHPDKSPGPDGFTPGFFQKS